MKELKRRNVLVNILITVFFLVQFVENEFKYYCSIVLLVILSFLLVMKLIEERKSDKISGENNF